jgi:hypothetical protein
MADLSPEASNAFKLPIFEISILKEKKSPHALVQILSPGGARGDFMFYPKLKSRQMMSAKSQPIIQPICSAVLFHP